MADDFALVRIVRINNPTDPKPTLVVKQLKVAKGDVTLGDLQLLDTANGTDVKFGLAKKLVDDTGKVFAFQPSPICVQDETNGPPPAACKAGELPQGFSVTPQVSTAPMDSFVLNVPQLSTKDANYKYTLFMQFTKPDGKIKYFSVDPRITNGGPTLTVDGTSTGTTASVTTQQAPGVGSSAFSLVLMAFLVLALGIVLGWVLSGGQRKN